MSRTALDEAMAALSAAVLENSEHPSPNELLAYQAGELAHVANTQLQEHLAWCSECARIVLDLAWWPDLELRDPALERTAAEAAEDWQAIQRRISGNAARVPFSVPPRASHMPPRSWRSFAPIHLAASLLLAGVALPFQAAKLSRWPALTQTVTSVTSGTNIFVVDLDEPVGTADGRR